MIYACEFASEKDNGHWHETYEEAQNCIKSWEKWRNPIIKLNKFRRTFSYKPHGTAARDGTNYGIS